jgi:dephospho-CoA kinase
MTKIIGLTGGIGSGKTTIANYFKSLGIPVYIADDEAKKVMQLTEIVNQIKLEFGKNVFENDLINTSKLAKLVFNNPEQLKQLNKIVHPAVKKHFDNWVLKHKDFPFVIKEAAILFESGSFQYCDKIITVIAPIETRIKRVMERDQTSRENVLNRINSQWTDEQKTSKSDFVITNISFDDAENQVCKIVNLLSD